MVTPGFENMNKGDNLAGSLVLEKLTGLCKIKKMFKEIFLISIFHGEQRDLYLFNHLIK